ncbi:Allene oxide synthase 3 [Camellia lanceoleosa]|uniref:Allene oxide synthase 3 n=1 Tax=Camellia lanceoleosa TaxID=1840588 RepID=A0ACC0HSK5_9ERIC|nr:Allene oxide synthase 3 [Camellia lanceoleosa]
MLSGDHSSPTLPNPIVTRVYICAIEEDSRSLLKPNTTGRQNCDVEEQLTICKTHPSSGPELVDKWQNYDMAMLQPFGLRKVPRFLKDFARNMNLIPNSFFTSNYNKLCDAFEVHAKPILDEAVRMGIKRDEACHNLVFFACSNAYGGFKAWFPVLIKWVGLAGMGKEVHKQLANEIRSIVNSANGVTFAALNKMALTSSVVYEALRIEPPFPFQYGRAKEELVVQSHEAAFKID